MKQCICIGMRALTPFLNRRDTAKLLIYRYPTFANWISCYGFRDQLLTWCLPHVTHHWESKLALVFYNYYYWQHCCWCCIPPSSYKWISNDYIEKEKLKEIKPQCTESYLIAIFKQANDQVSDVHKYLFSLWKRPHSNISYCSNVNWILISKFSNPGKMLNL